MNSFSILYLLLASLSSHHFMGRTEGTVVINEGTLTMFGTSIDSKWSHDSFVNALGKEEREYSCVDIYDTKGIMLWNKYKKPGINNDSSITEFKTVFIAGTERTSSWACEKPYEGNVIIEGNVININTGYDELTAALPQYHFSSSGGRGWYDGVYKDIYIYAQFTDSLDQLIYLAIGLDEGDNYKQ